MTVKVEQQAKGEAHAAVLEREMEALLSSDQQQLQHQQLSPVAQMFEGQSVFVTGASGFIGRVLLEKLLRCYPGIRRIYILLRPKRNLQPSERLHKHLLKAPVFDSIRAHKNAHELFDKICVVSGDIGEHQLGISEQDRAMLLDDPTLSLVFHSAASVKFDEPLKTSIKFNLQATRLIIELCKRMRHLRCLCHVSTAYVNSDQRDGKPIEERMYPMQEEPGRVLQMAELMDERMMQKLKPEMVGRRPNTYTYTKALAEQLIALEASELPVAIVRPSIVVAAWREPLPGWIDNLNGPTGLVLAIGKGLLRTMRAMRDCKADIIPVDVVVNTMIAAAHYAANEAQTGRERRHQETVGAAAVSAPEAKQDEKHDQDQRDQDNYQDEEDQLDTFTTSATTKLEPPIFHCTSGDVNPITWGNMEQMFWPIILKYPSQQVLRYPAGTFKAHKLHDLIMRLFVHFLPALIIDLLCLVSGKKRQLLSIYNKLHRAIEALDNFCTTNYEFKTPNLRALQASLTHPLDRSQLYMDISSLDWLDFWDNYVLGARRYVLKEEDDSLEVSRKSFQRARYLEWGLRTILLLVAVACLWPLIGPSARQLAASAYQRLAITA